MGIATSATALPLEEHAKALRVSKPRIIPVLDNGQFIGTVTSESVMAELRNVDQNSNAQEVSRLEAV